VAYSMTVEKLGLSLKFLRQRARKFLIEVFLKVHSASAANHT